MAAASEAWALLLRLGAAGVSLYEGADGRLYAEPASALSPAGVAAVRAARDALLALVRSRDAALADAAHRAAAGPWPAAALRPALFALNRDGSVVALDFAKGRPDEDF